MIPISSIQIDLPFDTPPSTPISTPNAPAVVQGPHNIHNMKTRAKVRIFKLKVFQAKLELASTKQALTIPYWKQAMDDEYSALMLNSIVGRVTS